LDGSASRRRFVGEADKVLMTKNHFISQLANFDFEATQCRTFRL